MGLKQVETEDLEFKSNWRDEYLKVICAFANAAGGKLVIGVDDSNSPIGIKNSKRLLEDIPNKIRNKLGITPSVEVEQREGKDIIGISVNSASTPISCDGKYYLRSGSTDLELKGNELVNFIIKKVGKS